MERFYKRKSEAEAVVPPVPVPPTVVAENSQNIIRDESRVINLATLESDPGLRIPIENYNVNIQDEVRRRYMLQGPCQPDNHIFPLTKFGQKCRRFNPKWFKEFSNWLENSIIDMQLQELNSRFDEVNTTLLLCISCLCPDDLFVAFDKQKLIQLGGCYPEDFSPIELLALDDQLQNYITDMLSSIEFSDLKGITALAKKMVELGRDKVYPLVYKLLTLSLILPVATASVERVFSGMHLVKTAAKSHWRSVVK